MKIRFIPYLYTQQLAIIDVVKVSMVENGKMTGICLRTSSLFAMMIILTMMTILTNQPTIM